MPVLLRLAAEIPRIGDRCSAWGATLPEDSTSSSISSGIASRQSFSRTPPAPPLPASSGTARVPGPPPYSSPPHAPAGARRGRWRQTSNTVSTPPLPTHPTRRRPPRPGSGPTGDPMPRSAGTDSLNPSYRGTLRSWWRRGGRPFDRGGDIGAARARPRRGGPSWPRHVRLLPSRRSRHPVPRTRPRRASFFRRRRFFCCAAITPRPDNPAPSSAATTATASRREPSDVRTPAAASHRSPSTARFPARPPSPLTEEVAAGRTPRRHMLAVGRGRASRRLARYLYL
jgi:hypothetical protein